jgi:hypothetical protein
MQQMEPYSVKIQFKYSSIPVIVHLLHKPHISHITYRLTTTSSLKFQVTDHQPCYALRHFNVSLEVRVLCECT